MRRNWCFFDAPVGMIITIDAQHNAPQYADLDASFKTSASYAENTDFTRAIKKRGAYGLKLSSDNLESPMPMS